MKKLGVLLMIVALAAGGVLHGAKPVRAGEVYNAMIVQQWDHINGENYMYTQLNPPINGATVLLCMKTDQSVDWCDFNHTEFDFSATSNVQIGAIAQSKITGLAAALAAKQNVIGSGTSTWYVGGDLLLHAPPGSPAWGSITGTLSGQTDLQAALDAKVPTTRTVNGNPLSSNITISSVTGNAGTATALQTARNINGVLFDGTADITIAAAAGTLTGSTLNSGITASSLTSVGTLTAGSTGAGFTVNFGTSTFTGANAIANGGTGATNTAQARANLGVVTTYSGTTIKTGAKEINLSATTVGGVATFNPTSDGTASGTALCTSTPYKVQASASASTTSAVAVPAAAIKTVSADRKTITVNATVGRTLLVLGDTQAFAPDGTTVYLSVGCE